MEAFLKGEQLFNVILKERELVNVILYKILKHARGLSIQNDTEPNSLKRYRTDSTDLCSK